MKYNKKNFGTNLFFFLGFTEGAITEHNKQTEQKINMERFAQFRKYCFKRFVKKGRIVV